MADLPLIQIPVYHTSLIGRSQDVAALTAQLRDPATRLLTLLGPSGSGKTRLALEGATAVTDAFPDGVVFVALAPVQDPRFVIPTIAQSFAIREEGETPLLTRLGQVLAPRQMLLLLDNIEQVLDCAAELATLLAAAPRLTLLVTSQLPLNLPAETIYSLPPLAVPNDDAPRTPTDTLAYPAIALFVERLQAVQPRFQLTATSMPAVVRICQLLDGFPLAIELVAAHSATLDPRDLLLLLRNHLGVHPHQASVPVSSRTAILHPVMDWCSSRLPVLAKTLLLRLGVFWGGWTTEAAHAVLTPEKDLETVAEALTLLVQKHLVQIETLPGQQPRYVVLDAIHDYSRERLRHQRRDGSFRARHAAYYADLAQQMAAAARGPDLAHWLPRLREEVHNLRAALQWHLDQPDPTSMLQMSLDLVPLWHTQGWHTEACGWLEPALARAPDAPILLRARAWNTVGMFSAELGRFAQAQAALETSSQLFAQLGDRRGHGTVLGNLARLFNAQGRLTETYTLYEQALVLFQQCVPPDERGISITLANLGQLSLDHGDLAAAQRYLEECLALGRRLADQSLPMAIDMMSQLTVLQGDLATAQALLDEGIPLAEQLGVKYILTHLQRNAGLVALERGDAAAATVQLRQVLEIQQAANNPIEQIRVLQLLGYSALVQQRVDEAAAWLREAQALGETVGPNEASVEVVLQRSRLTMAQGNNTAAWTLMQEAIHLIRTGGKRRLLPEVAEQAALLLDRQGHHKQAITLWHTAAASRRTAGLPRLPSLLHWYHGQTIPLALTNMDLPAADLDDLHTLLVSAGGEDRS